MRAAVTGAPHSMMSPAECRAKAHRASEVALSSRDPTARARWTETAAGWLKLASMGAAQAVLEEHLLGLDPD